jgi:hypothetical protein
MSHSNEGRHDINKQKIRETFTKNFHKTFGNYALFTNDQHIRFHSKLMYYLFKELGHIDARGNKKVPDYIYNSNESIQQNFLYGLYLADGSLNINYKTILTSDKFSASAVVIHNTSRPLIVGVSHLLEMLGIDYYIHTYQPHAFGKRQFHVYIKDPLQTNIKIQRNRDKLDYRTSARTQQTVEYLDRSDELVYDISVTEAENFVAGRLLAHNSIFDEGIDVRPLDTVILAGQGKSSVRAMQRIGRICRPYTYSDGTIKTRATAIDPVINDKFLKKHSQSRETMYSTEPAYNIEHIEEFS